MSTEVVVALITVGIPALMALITLFVTRRQKGKGGSDAASSSPSSAKHEAVGSGVGLGSSGDRLQNQAFRALAVNKVVDMRHNVPVGSENSRKKAATGHAVIYDHYMLERTAAEPAQARFYYSSSRAIVGSCVSHADRYSFEPVNSDHMKYNCVINVDLGELPVGEVAQVTNRIEYKGGFNGWEQEEIETHVDRPTASITWVVLFAERRTCGVIEGRTAHPRDEWVICHAGQPRILDHGRLVMWGVRGRRSGEQLAIDSRYSMKWTWKNNVGLRPEQHAHGEGEQKPHGKVTAGTDPAGDTGKAS